MCVQWLQVLPLEVGDEVIEVMLIPDKPAKDELVMLVTTAGVKIKQPLDRLMEHFWHEAYKCTAVQVGTASFSGS